MDPTYWCGCSPADAVTDPWTICERALALAYLHDPLDFASKRDSLAQKLFAPEKLDFRRACLHLPPPASFCSLRHPSLAPSCDAKALSQQLDDEMLCKQDVLAMKSLLQDASNSFQSEEETYRCLQKLELMHLSLDLLKETQIGKVVNGFRKSQSPRIAALAKRLVRNWKALVDTCFRNVATTANTSETVVTSTSGSTVSDDEPSGLPIPPMDEAALLTASMASVDMVQLWDMIDDIAPADVARPTLRVTNNHRHKDFTVNEYCRRQDMINGIHKMAKEVSNASTRSDVVCDDKSGLHQSAFKSEQRKDEFGSQLKNLTDEKMEAAKRNLRVNYGKEENAKRQRTIQVLELDDLPNRGSSTRARISHLMHSRPSSQPRPRVLICR